MLVGYYRLLLGVPQKTFYASGTGMSQFKSMEEDGRGNPGAIPVTHNRLAVLPVQSKERIMTEQSATLYARLGGYDAIAAVADDLLPRLMSDPQLSRFWAHRAADSIRREKQLLIDFLCASAGGPMYYPGRDMVTSHKGMGISASDWEAFLGHLRATLDKFRVPESERRDVLAFVESTEPTSSKNGSPAPGRLTGHLGGHLGGDPCLVSVLASRRSARSLGQQEEDTVL